jgi:hypothetical protein
MSQQELSAPALAQLTVEPSVSQGLGYPNHRIDAPVAPTGWQPIRHENLNIVGLQSESSAPGAESGS